MSVSKPLVAVDACVLVEAVLFAGSKHPSVRILDAARRRYFRLAIVAQAETEARRALSSDTQTAALNELLTSCDLVRLPDASEEALRDYKREIWSLVPHEAECARFL